MITKANKFYNCPASGFLIILQNANMVANGKVNCAMSPVAFATNAKPGSPARLSYENVRSHHFRAAAFALVTVFVRPTHKVLDFV